MSEGRNQKESNFAYIVLWQELISFEFLDELDGVLSLLMFSAISKFKY